jgi:hypothetical protein
VTQSGLLEDCTAGPLSRRRAPLEKTLCAPFSPTSHGVRVRVARFLKDQLFYLAIAVVIYGSFWAIRPEATNLFITVVYTLSLCNLITFALERLSFLYFERTPLHYWLVYLALAGPHAFHGHGYDGDCALAGGPPRRGIPGLSVDELEVSLYRHGHVWDRVPDLYRDKVPSGAPQPRVGRDGRIGYCGARASRRRTESRARNSAGVVAKGNSPNRGVREPARIVGGDYFDVIRLSEKKLGICIADVVGKGVPAALFMANVQATVRAYASESASAAWLCARVNSVVCANIAAGQFVTLFYGVLDEEQKTIKYASAGHPRPMLRVG